MNICFVILCYKTFNETVECVSSIKKLEYSDAITNINIVIVDNASNDSTFENLSKLYNEAEYVYLVKNEFNVGFAKGNNLGFIVAKHTIHADFIVCLNSDVVIEQTDFCIQLVEEYKKMEFDIAGPNIITKNGIFQNPVSSPIDTIAKVRHIMLKNRLIYIKTYIPILNKVKRKKEGLNKEVKETVHNVCLHGSCIIFSPKYVINYENAFYPNTFLYAEEDILYYISRKRNLQLTFLPTLLIHHLEDCSLNGLFRYEMARKRFILKNSYKSLQVLKKIMINGVN